LLLPQVIKKIGMYYRVFKQYCIKKQRFFCRRRLSSSAPGVVVIFADTNDGPAHPCFPYLFHKPPQLFEEL